MLRLDADMRKVASAEVCQFPFLGLLFVGIQCVVSIPKMDQKLQVAVNRARSLLGVADVLLKQSQLMRRQTTWLLGDTQHVAPRQVRKPQMYRRVSIDEFPSRDHRGRMDSTRNPAGVDFLRTEFETSSVFLKIARDTADGEKKLRNVENARKGYDTLLHFLQRLRLTPDEREEMKSKVSELRCQLLDLGERL